MDSKSLEMLEFPKVREIIAGYTSFALSRELVLSLLPSSNAGQVALMLKKSAEARHLLSLVTDFSIGDVTDIRESLKLATIGQALEPQRLVEIQKTLTAFRYLRTRLNKVAQEIPLLWEVTSQLVPMPEMEKELAGCISPAGELMDSASSRLAELREQLRQTRSQLVQRLEAIIKSQRSEKYLQEPLVTERDGRYVIPIKIELRKEFKGIVHDISNTGATAFVEPVVTVELGNQVRELAIEEEREAERILASLSTGIAENEAVISQNLALVAELDLALAKARYADRVNASEAIIGCPAAGEDSGKSLLKLVKARHPLLKTKPVPLTLEIGKDFRVLIITGPNTGGKTVALKTIGLLTLMTQAGLPIPAAKESCMPVFDLVFADIGDEQSIEQTLSTFSWHMGNIVHILHDSTDKSLVLLDELGTSTDPAEGAALAQSILLRFLTRGAMAVATTHLSDLKAFAHSTPGIENASLDFDPVTLAPAYNLTVGMPGGSNALATAARLGLPPEIISDARARLGGGTREIEGLLADVMTEKQKVEALREELEKDKTQAEALRKSLDEELLRLKEKEQNMLQEVRNRLVREGDELMKLISDAVSELKRKKSKESIEQARKALAAMREQLKTETWQPHPEETGRPVIASGFAEGDRVWLKDMNLQGTVTTPPDEMGQLEVQVGQTRVRLGIDGVDRASPPAGEIAPFTTVKRAAPRQAVSLELDLRGKRAVEIEGELDTYLNDASLANLSEVRIIHGFGTGVVRQIVRDLLASHPLVKSFRSGLRGEGGDGATVVTL